MMMMGEKIGSDVSSPRSHSTLAVRGRFFSAGREWRCDRELKKNSDTKQAAQTL